MYQTIFLYQFFNVFKNKILANQRVSKHCANYPFTYIVLFNLLKMWYFVVIVFHYSSMVFSIPLGRQTTIVRQFHVHFLSSAMQKNKNREKHWSPRVEKNKQQNNIGAGLETGKYRKLNIEQIS